MRLLALLAITGWMASFGACSSSTTHEGVATGGTNAGGSGTGGASTGGASTGGATTGGSSGTGGSGTGSTAGTGGSTDGGLACPSGLKGPAMAAVEAGYCIDKTEVTNAHYAEFLAAQSDSGDITKLSACKSITSYDPGSSAGCPTFAPGTDVSFPVRCVDWCSAYAYCKWAGKRLCGKIPSGDALPAKAKSADNQWYMACAGPNESDQFFYGQGNEPGRCVDKTVGTVKAVGSTMGGANECGSFFYPGLTDMLGNVSEWEDACDAPQSENTQCNTRGGSAASTDGSTTCGTATKQSRTEHLPDVGFRCCWDSSVGN